MLIALAEKTPMLPGVSQYALLAIAIQVRFTTCVPCRPGGLSSYLIVIGPRQLGRGYGQQWGNAAHSGSPMGGADIRSDWDATAGPES